MAEDSHVLTGTVDRYNGITIDTETETVIGDEFANRLQSKTRNATQNTVVCNLFTSFWPLHSFSGTLAKEFDANDLV